MVCIFLSPFFFFFFYTSIIQTLLGEIWLGKNSTFLWKNPTDRRLPHSNISELIDNQPCPCWLSVCLLPITWKAAALMLSMTGWPHLAKWESELQKGLMLKEGLQLGCPFFLLLLQQQRESKGYCKILLPRDMQVSREFMQLKKPYRAQGNL